MWTEYFHGDLYFSLSFKFVLRDVIFTIKDESDTTQRPLILHLSDQSTVQHFFV